MFCFDTQTPGRTARLRPRQGRWSVKTVRVAAAALLAVAAPASAWAQGSVSHLVTGQAQIFQPISITKCKDLQFGVVVRPRSGSGTVTQPADGGMRTTSGGVSLITTTGPAAPQAATFEVNGEVGQAFSIGVDASTTLTRAGGGTLNVTLASSAATATITSSTPTPGCTTIFGVGGTITNVSDATATGVYTGSFVVTVTYN
jgi:hypothetical protein